jgi:L-rhamnose-H+ transport protein
MGYNPIVGLLYHWIGGLSSATCYLPYRGLKQWAWEVYWLVQGIASWLAAPLVVGLLLVPHARTIVQAAGHTVGFVYMWGALWGFGALTFGLSVRYLGVALGYAIALGLCTAFGTLMPPLFSGELSVIVHTTSGKVILLGVATCVAGIALSGIAGILREHEMDHDEKKAVVKDFNFGRGIGVAVFSGVMSSCFACGIASGKSLTLATRAALFASGKSDLWQGLPALTIVMLGGFTTNLVWCVYLLLRNGTLAELWGKQRGNETEHADGIKSPLLRNYGLSVGGGLLWYLQYFFYTMGQTRMGKYEFSSWSLHMASIIIFSTLWGLYFKEWKGTSGRTHSMLYLGLVVLIASTMLVGYGSYLKLNGPTP